MNDATLTREDWNREYEDGTIDGSGPPVEQLVAAVTGLKPGTALDLGCGAGTNSIWLAQRGWDVTGIDWAKDAIRVARSSAEQTGVRAKFEVADLTEWTPSLQYDLVISTYALPSGKESQRRTIEKASNAVGPGGILLFAEWDRSSAGTLGWPSDDLVTVDEIVTYIGDSLAIEKAEVVAVDVRAHHAREGMDHESSDHSHHGDHNEPDEWKAVLVLARRPG